MDWTDLLATPLDGFSSAVDAAIEALRDHGLGGWRVERVANLAQAVDDESRPFAIPLLLPDGTLIGALCPAGLPDDQPSDADLSFVAAVARLLVTVAALEQAADAATRRASRAEQLSLVDRMTELPNATAWQEALDREATRGQRSSTSLMVAVVDLDDLKRVNDADGHLAGDLLLRATGQALRAAVRGTDIVARVGGDEFGVLAIDYDELAPHALVERIRSVLATAGINASVGAVVHRPDEDIRRSVHEADLAMYLDKRRRKPDRAPG